MTKVEERASQLRGQATRRPLAEPVALLILDLQVLAVELVLDVNVQIAGVFRVRAAAQAAFQLLPLADGDDVLQVEHGLLPVGVLVLGA